MNSVIPMARLTDVQEHRRGARPWTLITVGTTSAMLTDADGHELMVTQLGLGHLIVTAVNSYSDLMADNACLTEAMIRAKRELLLHKQTPAVVDAIRLADAALGLAEVDAT